MFARGLCSSEQWIAREASLLLREYERERAMAVKPPVPVDDIVETHLRLTMNYVDMAQVFGRRGLLGATSEQSQAIYVDRSLDPLEYPEMEGRHNFTIAHEIGHWVLHRGLAPDQPHMLLDPNLQHGNDLPSRRERQADRFASLLLMPALLLRNAWLQDFGDLAAVPYVTRGARRKADEAPPSEGRRRVERLSEIFSVSRQAMRIRLQELKLIQVTTRSEVTR